MGCIIYVCYLHIEWILDRTDSKMFQLQKSSSVITVKLQEV